MALIFIDGFDHSGTSFTAHQQKYDSAVLPCAIVSTPVRTGAGALQLGAPAATSLSKSNFTIPPGTAIIMGLAFRRVNGPAANQEIFSFTEAGIANHLSVILTPAGRFGVKSGVTVLATGTLPVADNTWYYLELKGVIGPAGYYELRVDGVVEVVAQAAVNTQYGGTGVVNYFSLFGPISPVIFYLDDLYFADGTGAAPGNNFLGPVKVETLMPQTDAVQAGSNQGLTPSAGTDHGALVDEVPANTTDYNSSALVGAKDTYQYPPMNLPGAILGVQTNLYIQKSDAAARQVCAVVRSGGTDYDGANVAPLTSWKYFTEIRPIDPKTAAPWTQAAIATLEAGMKVTG